MKEKGFSALLIIIVIAVVAAVAVFIFLNLPKNQGQTQGVVPPIPSKPDKAPANLGSVWQEKGVILSGQYADAEVVDLGNGKYRMYYSVEPEVPNNNLEVYSSVSTDGINWTKEEGVRKTMATFPDVIKLPDGTWRMYFQNAGLIKSAKSSDGLNWIDEPGVRVDSKEPGFNLENVAAQSTIRLDNGTYLMVYRGTINKPYETTEKIPNKDTHIYFWATSKDGLAFEKKGLAIDSRNDTLFGAADGAEWVKFNDESTVPYFPELRVYFWSYAGIFYVVYHQETSSVGGGFSAPVFEFTNNKDLMAKFAPNPPSDPTLANINGKWFIYYGQHTKGIYYATKQ